MLFCCGRAETRVDVVASPSGKQGQCTHANNNSHDNPKASQHPKHTIRN